MGKFFSFVHMGKSYISKVPIGPEVSKTNLGTGPGPCKKCGLGPGPGGPLIAGGLELTSNFEARRWVGDRDRDPGDVS